MFYKLVFYLFDKISLFENIFEHLPLTTLTVHVEQADLRSQPLQMPHIQNAPENREARGAQLKWRKMKMYVGLILKAS